MEIEIKESKSISIDAFIYFIRKKIEKMFLFLNHDWDWEPLLLEIRLKKSIWNKNKKKLKSPLSMNSNEEIGKYMDTEVVFIAMLMQW